jgi:uncharacterized 2Fe-2S/4Fe-4S cluster protein (DUF4445 family)
MMKKNVPGKKMKAKPVTSKSVHQQHDEHEHHHRELFIIRQDGAVEEVDFHEATDDRMKPYKIIFQPLGRRGEIIADETLLDCARRLGVGINNVCGGNGTCLACRLQVVEGKVTAPTRAEEKAFTPAELSRGWRLACRARLESDGRIFVPAESMTTAQRLQVEGLEVTVTANPPVQAYHLQLPPPTLQDLRADSERMLAALKEKYGVVCRRVDFGLLQEMSPCFRRLDWNFQVIVRGDEIIAVRPPRKAVLGLAVDIGTTKIAAYLLDLTSGKTLLSKGLMNPQISYGEDVISRITLAMKSPAEATRLQRVLVEAVNHLGSEMCGQIGAESGDITETVIVGNTAIHHLFLKLPVAQLVAAPFLPAVASSYEVKARELGLKFAPGSYVYSLPNIAGFVGADHVAALLATRPWENDGTTLLIDIGTNTEISLTHNKKTIAVSCASGPAFEGGHITHGMRAANGAVEKVRIEGKKILLQTIGNQPPVGICGSGILDALAQMYLAGIIDQSGKMQSSHPAVRNGAKQREFVLSPKQDETPDVVITQQDIRELQLAKAAVRVGIQSLLNACKITERSVSRVIIAGAFGSYIDVGSAIVAGMLPDIPLAKYRQVGNAAGTGARLALISSVQRTIAENIAGKVNYLELAGAPGFMNLFVRAGALGKYKLNDATMKTKKG